MVINSALLDSLTIMAKESPRLRMNLDLRNSLSDKSQRMLNAIEPGSPMPIHRHRNSSETVVVLRGHFREDFYSEEGVLTESVDLIPGGESMAINIPAGEWHTITSLESGSVILETKDGPYEPLSSEDIMEL